MLASSVLEKSIEHIDKTATILVVDDEPFNLEIIVEYLEDQNYELITAESGEEAWTLLEQSPDAFDAVLLDRMLPGIDGLEVLNRIKKHPQLNNLPVIFQTARSGKNEVLEGIQAGAFYYLTKPFEEDMLCSIIQAALDDRQHQQDLQNELQQHISALDLMHSGNFYFRTLEEAKRLSSMLARAAPYPERMIIGLSELLINAVEHGNAGISYEEKGSLIEEGKWAAEVQRRIDLPENRDKEIQVILSKVNGETSVTIKDQGKGFDWRKYLEISPERAYDCHGRGIAMARMMSFKHLEYRADGSEVFVLLHSE